MQYFLLNILLRVLSIYSNNRAKCCTYHNFVWRNLKRPEKWRLFFVFYSPETPACVIDLIIFHDISLKQSTKKVSSIFVWEELNKRLRSVISLSRSLLPINFVWAILIVKKIYIEIKWKVYAWDRMLTTPRRHRLHPLRHHRRWVNASYINQKSKVRAHHIDDLFIL